MKTTLIFSMTALLVAAGCGRGGGLHRDQKDYEVVQEGQASGVSSTIAGPGETAPPTLPMTGTNADTTTAFTLPAATTTSTAPPGTIAGTLPTDTAPARPRTVPTDPQPRPSRPPTTTTPPPQPPPADTQPAPPPPPEEKKDEPPPTDTQPPPPSDTQPPPSDTQAPPPPPPGT